MHYDHIGWTKTSRETSFLSQRRFFIPYHSKNKQLRTEKGTPIIKRIVSFQHLHCPFSQEHPFPVPVERGLCVSLRLYYLYGITSPLQAQELLCALQSVQLQLFSHLQVPGWQLHRERDDVRIRRQSRSDTYEHWLLSLQGQPMVD